MHIVYPPDSDRDTQALGEELQLLALRPTYSNALLKAVVRCTNKPLLNLEVRVVCLLDLRMWPVMPTRGCAGCDNVRNWGAQVRNCFRLQTW